MNEPRRQFLRTAVALGAAFAVNPLPAQAPADAPPVPKRPPPLAAELVKEFVVAAHADLPATQALLARQPRLINATWDWGGGDFETALGGASHMGRRDIAQFLLDEGARPDVFAHAMLGHLEAVQAILRARPDVLRCRGPHGIPLLVHAEKGGAEAAAVADYLRRLTTAG